MMPDLGKYAETVLSSYAISLLLITGLVMASVIRARRMRRKLDEVEKRVKGHG